MPDDITLARDWRGLNRRDEEVAEGESPDTTDAATHDDVQGLLGARRGRDRALASDAKLWGVGQLRLPTGLHQITGGSTLVAAPAALPTPPVPGGTETGRDVIAANALLVPTLTATLGGQTTASATVSKDLNAAVGSSEPFTPMFSDHSIGQDIRHTASASSYESDLQIGTDVGYAQRMVVRRRSTSVSLRMYTAKPAVQTITQMTAALAVEEMVADYANPLLRRLVDSNAEVNGSTDTFALVRGIGRYPIEATP